MYANEKSDKAVVPKMRPNKESMLSAEVAEERALPKRNTSQTTAAQTQSWSPALTGLAGVRQVTQRRKEAQFTALLHHITVSLLEKSYCALKRKSASGLDGVTWQAYHENLVENLTALHSKIHNGTYRPKPARRTMIPKADGTERPLSILCLEDKIVQQAAVYVLDAIYEENFMGFSYGFRPGRGQHDALDSLSVGIYRKCVNWVLDADIQKFFDNMNHDWMLKFLQHRIGDKRLLRMITAWLKVGVMDGHHRQKATVGAPQGAVISPILANVYLHYVLDLWSHKWRRQEAKGDMMIIRYADDSVFGFEYELDAKRFLAELHERMKTFGLTLHPNKTRLICFGKNAIGMRKYRCQGKPETFDFLGFTHYCTVGFKRRGFVIGRKTIRKRMRASLKVIKAELRKRWHDPLAKTGKWMQRVLQGHINYFSVPGNDRSIWLFFKEVRRLWLQRIRKRSQRGFMSWSKFVRITTRFFPRIRLAHPHPRQRFNVRTQGRSPVR